VDVTAERSGGDAAQKICSTAKASPVRKRAPAFWVERTLSSTTVMGIFSIAANSSAEGLPSSPLAILCRMASEWFKSLESSYLKNKSFNF